MYPLCLSLSLSLSPGLSLFTSSKLEIPTSLFPLVFLTSPTAYQPNKAFKFQGLFIIHP